MCILMNAITLILFLFLFKKKWNLYNQYIKIGTFYSKIKSQKFYMEEYKDKHCILKDNIFLILIW